METNLSAEFSITASEPGAGPYDMSTTARTMLASTTLLYPDIAAFVVKSYDMLYNNPSNLSAYIQPAYLSAVNSAFDATKYNAGLTVLKNGTIAANALFNQSFLDGFLGTGEMSLKASIAKNNIYDWAPKTPTRLFHAKDDTMVPYANTEVALATMRTTARPVLKRQTVPRFHRSTRTARCLTLWMPRPFSRPSHPGCDNSW